MYLFRFLNTPLGGGGAATQTFAPGGKYPRAATGSLGDIMLSFALNQKMKNSRVSSALMLMLWNFQVEMK